MEKESYELVKTGLGIFSRELSPDYQRVRSMLLGSLAARGSSVEQLVDREQNDRGNVNFINEFVSLLPLAESDYVRSNCENIRSVHFRQHFTTSDPYEVKTIQSNVVWIPDSRMYHPYYIVGRREDEKGEQWLVSSANKSPALATYRPSKQDRKNAEKLKATASSDFPSIDEMELLFDPDKHVLNLHSGSPRSVRVNVPRPRKSRVIPKVISNRRDRGRSLYLPTEELNRISDAELGSFDTLSYMIRMATAFNLETDLAELIDKYSQ